MKEDNVHPRLVVGFRSLRLVAGLLSIAALFPLLLLPRLPDEEPLNSSFSHQLLLQQQILPFTSNKSPIIAEKKWVKTKFTLSKFKVAGVNLAKYDGRLREKPEWEQVEPYELFEDFNIGDRIRGDEGWWDLVSYHRELQHPSLSFYMDKVAQKRWLEAIDIPSPKTYVLNYASELTSSGILKDEKTTLLSLLPKKTNYAAKPTHKSCSDGVWLVKHDAQTDKTFIGQGGRKMKETKGRFDAKVIADSVAENLHEEADSDESWALRHVHPGVVVEERFTAWDSDRRAAMEFEVFTIWGRVWIANWRRGTMRLGIVHRNGTVVDWSEKDEDYTVLPDWVDWKRIVELAEKMGANKDMFRVDIFAGVPAGSPSLRKGATKEERLSAVQISVSETELHPTTSLNDPGLFEEAARLWIAGYKIGNYRLVPNSEVPPAFLETNSLSLTDAIELRHQNP